MHKKILHFSDHKTHPDFRGKWGGEQKTLLPTPASQVSYIRTIRRTPPFSSQMGGTSYNLKNTVRPLHMLSARDSLQIKRHTQTEGKTMEKIFHQNGNGQKKKLG